MPHQVDLQSWLNTHLFRRTDLHPIFRNLHRSGADLDYVHFLGAFLTFGDFVRRQLKFDRRSGLIYSPKPNFEKPERLNDALRPLEDLGLKVPLRPLDNLLRELDESFNSLGAIADVNPLFALFVQFAFPREILVTKGDPGDRWGNFFLLAFTEHLRSKSKGRNPKHLLAYRLLTMLRKDSLHIKNPRYSVAGRVAQLKKAHPHWRAALKLLKSEFHSQAALANPKVK